MYGAADRYPTNERDLPAPSSPYGVTKLAAEHLCSLYHRNFGVPTVSLRYFTVYGPRQRPDMATHRLIESALTGSEFVMFGDGSQIRDFTYVGDVVEANLAAATTPDAVGRVFNIGGGSAATMHDVVAAVTESVGSAPEHAVSARRPEAMSSAPAPTSQQPGPYWAGSRRWTSRTGVRRQVAALLDRAATGPDSVRVVPTSDAWRQRRPS